MKRDEMYPILIVVDEKKSSLNQALGLARAIKKNDKKIIIKSLDTSFIKYKGMPNFLVYFLLKINNIIDVKDLSQIKLIISCGRISAPVSLILKEKLCCQNVHINDPYFKRKLFTRIIIPRHDNFFNLCNSIETVGSIVHRDNKKINKEDSERFKKIIKFDKKKKIVTLLIGGSGKSSKFTKKDITKLFKILENIDFDKYELAFMFSRRTPELIKNKIRNKFQEKTYIWKESILNPYWYLINISDFLIVSSDSVSMTSDALISGKPVFIFKLKKIKKKIEDFHEYLQKKDYTNEFDGKFFKWKYKEFDEGKRIANILKVDLNI